MSQVIDSTEEMTLNYCTNNIEIADNLKYNINRIQYKNNKKIHGPVKIARRPFSTRTKNPLYDWGEEMHRINKPD